MSTQLIKPNYLVILPPTQHHSFFRNLPPLFNFDIFRFMQPYTIDLSTRRLWRINTEFAGFIPRSLVLGSIMILVYS